MPWKNLLKLRLAKQIALLNVDAVLKGLKAVRRADKRRHGMALLNGLPDDLETCAAGGAEYKEFHNCAWSA